VCGLCDLKDLSSIEKSGVDYQEKLGQFQNSMLKWNEYPYNYSLHL